MPKVGYIGAIHVASTAGQRETGVLLAPGTAARCALGRAGVNLRKREGDGATPIGSFRMVGVMARPDRGPMPETGLPLRTIGPKDGWCDDPADRRYNTFVSLPYPARHERLWRDDGLYNVVVVLDYNLDPAIAGRGSAIFLHCARPDFGPTEGCVAIAEPALRRLLTRCSPETMLVIR